MRIHRFLFLLFACCALGPPAFAQQPAGPFSINSTATSSCASISTAGFATIGIQVGGTWSATLQPQVSISGQAAANTAVYPAGSTTSQATITANGIYYAPVAGAATFLLCASAYSSGTAVVYLQGSAGSSASRGGGGGGGAPYPSGSGLAQVSAGSAWTTTIPLGTSAGNVPQINSNSQLPLPTGTSSLPGIAFSLIPNNGMYVATDTTTFTVSTTSASAGTATLTLANSGFTNNFKVGEWFITSAIGGGYDCTISAPCQITAVNNTSGTISYLSAGTGTETSGSVNLIVPSFAPFGQPFMVNAIWSSSTNHANSGSWGLGPTDAIRYGCPGCTVSSFTGKKDQNLIQPNGSSGPAYFGDYLGLTAIGPMTGLSFATAGCSMSASTINCSGTGQLAMTVPGSNASLPGAGNSDLTVETDGNWYASNNNAARNQLLTTANGITSLTGDVTSSGFGASAATVVGFSGVPKCGTFSPTNGQVYTYTTGGSPNPCIAPTTVSGGAGTPGYGIGIASSVVTNSLPGTDTDVASYSGSTLDAKLTAAIAAEPAAGAVLNLGNLRGAQSFAATVTVNVANTTIVIPDGVTMTPTSASILGALTITAANVTVRCASKFGSLFDWSGVNVSSSANAIINVTGSAAGTFTVEGCHFKGDRVANSDGGAGQACIRVSPGTANYITGIWVRNNFIENCGSFGASINQAGNVHIEGNTFQQTSTAAIQVNTGTVSNQEYRDWYVINNVVYDSNTAGLSGVAQINIINPNYATPVTIAGFHVEGNTVKNDIVGGDGTGADDLCNGSGSSTATGCGQGIEVNNAGDGTVIGNTLRGFEKECISVANGGGRETINNNNLSLCGATTTGTVTTAGAGAILLFYSNNNNSANTSMEVGNDTVFDSGYAVGLTLGSGVTATSVKMANIDIHDVTGYVVAEALIKGLRWTNLSGTGCSGSLCTYTMSNVTIHHNKFLGWTTTGIDYTDENGGNTGSPVFDGNQISASGIGSTSDSVYGCTSGCNYVLGTAQEPAPGSQTVVTGATASANTSYIIRFNNVVTRKVGNGFINVGTNVAGGVASLAVYNSSGTQVWTSGSISTASTGIVTFTPTAYTMIPGTYYLAYCTSSATPVLAALVNSAAGQPGNFWSATAVANTYGVTSDACSAGIVPASITPSHITNQASVQIAAVMITN